ncbi:MAG: MarR family transcriptional regulator [Candidatus Obscuribacterales bacterium]|nr:MarR family transcriptional regulator [Candidatus Obscuribacterales bacterium]
MDKHKVKVDAVLVAAGELHGILGRLKRRLREEYNTGDLTLSQLAVLGHLDRNGPATVTNLAKAEGVRSQSMGATVATLEAAGLVSGSADPNDGRQTVIHITPLCREKIDARLAARQDWLFRSIKAKLSPPEQEQLASAIQLLKRLVDE